MCIKTLPSLVTITNLLLRMVSNIRQLAIRCDPACGMWRRYNPGTVQRTVQYFRAKRIGAGWMRSVDGRTRCLMSVDTQLSEGDQAAMKHQTTGATTMEGRNQLKKKPSSDAWVPRLSVAMQQTGGGPFGGIRNSPTRTYQTAYVEARGAWRHPAKQPDSCEKNESAADGNGGDDRQRLHGVNAEHHCARM